MSDVADAPAVAAETPVNPYSLLEAVNNSSDTVHSAWLIFIAIVGYLTLAIAGVSHKDLLLSSDILLPVLQVRIDLTRFFLFAPILIVLFHVGVITQLVMLARKTLELDAALRLLEPTPRRTHPLRLELHNFFFVQAIAGPERSRVMSVFLHALSWLTMVVVPVLLLLYVQVSFIPYHDVWTTWAHRIALLTDIVLLILIGVFLTRPESSFLRAFLGASAGHPVTFAVTFMLMVLVGAFSFLVATVPGEPLDRLARRLAGVERGATPTAFERASYGFVMPFLGNTSDGRLFGLFERNLNVTDLDLVVDKDVTAGEATLNLRGRNLRYARLDRTDLHQADLTGADLDGASLVGADLRQVTMQCGNVGALILSDDRKAARCPSAKRADFTKARMKDARLAGIDLRYARLDEADLEGADLAYAAMIGANLRGANLQKAEITGGAVMHGADLSTASLQGADFTGAKLNGADFTSAGLQGAVLAHAALRGARLQNADLEGADLYRARLEGADLSGARLKSASLHGAAVWKATAPESAAFDEVATAELDLRPVSDGEGAALERIVAGLPRDYVRTLVEDALKPLFPLAVKAISAAASGGGSDTWARLAVSSGTAPVSDRRTRLTQQLLTLACKPRWANGSIATGIAKRAAGPDFEGDAAAILEGLRAASCPGGGNVAKRILERLAASVDTVRGN